MPWPLPLTNYRFVVVLFTALNYMALNYLTIKELRQKGQAELHKLLAEARQAVQETSFQAAAKQLKDVSVVRKAKRQVARVMSVLGELTQVK
jgi:ribosomal protein L29